MLFWTPQPFIVETKTVKTFFNFVFCGEKKDIQVWNCMKVINDIRIVIVE